MTAIERPSLRREDPPKSQQLEGVASLGLDSTGHDAQVQLVSNATSVRTMAGAIIATVFAGRVLHGHRKERVRDK